MERCDNVPGVLGPARPRAEPSANMGNDKSSSEKTGSGQSDLENAAGPTSYQADAPAEAAEHTGAMRLVVLQMGMAVQKTVAKRKLVAVKEAAFAYKKETAKAYQQRAAAEARAAEFFFANHDHKQELQAKTLELADAARRVGALEAENMELRRILEGRGPLNSDPEEPFSKRQRKEGPGAECASEMGGEQKRLALKGGVDSDLHQLLDLSTLPAQTSTRLSKAKYTQEANRRLRLLLSIGHSKFDPTKARPPVWWPASMRWSPKEGYTSEDAIKAISACKAHHA